MLKNNLCIIYTEVELVVHVTSYSLAVHVTSYSLAVHVTLYSVAVHVTSYNSQTILDLLAHTFSYKCSYVCPLRSHKRPVNNF